MPEAMVELKCNGVAKKGHPCTFSFGRFSVAGGSFTFERPCPHCKKVMHHVFSDQRIKTYAAKA